MLLGADILNVADEVLGAFCFASSNGMRPHLPHLLHARRQCGVLLVGDARCANPAVRGTLYLQVAGVDLHIRLAHWRLLRSQLAPVVPLHALLVRMRSGWGLAPLRDDRVAQAADICTLLRVARPEAPFVRVVVALPMAWRPIELTDTSPALPERLAQVRRLIVRLLFRLLPDEPRMPCRWNLFNDLTRLPGGVLGLHRAWLVRLA
mmetsp:Transcript_102947/g.297617  ORF Transcript_102947/g.297617 Transcript_102947/m.297617 type:complete len:206 (-) Transcript_102947:4808-5425(-)